MQSLLSLGSLFVVLCGLGVGWLVGAIVPAAIRDGALELRRQPYQANWEAEPFVIDDSRRLDVPWQFADFDLQMDVELGAGTSLDLVARRVEPRMIGSRFEQFHGRFTALRLSAGRGGEPWFTRDRLLLGGGTAAGADLAPGITATVWVEGRGRTLTANIAGKKLPPFASADTYGAFTFIAHGGTAVLKNISIVSCGQPDAWLWSSWTWLAFGLLAGVLVRAVGLVAGHGALLQGVLLLLPVGTVAGWRLEVAPLWHPWPSVLWLLLGTAVCAGLAGRRRWSLPMIAAVIALGWLSPSLERDEADIDALFGPKAGSALAEAHAQLVRGPFMIHDVSPAEARVFLLGGQLVYGMHGSTQHLEALLAGDLRVASGKRVDVPCLPTVDGHPTQQWAMFERFYRGYAPNVIVFAVAGEEGSVVTEAGVPRTRPGDLERTLAAVREYCAGSGARLVLLAGAGLSPALAAVLRNETGRGATLLAEKAGEPRPELSRRLTAAIAPLLQ